MERNQRCVTSEQAFGLSKTAILMKKKVQDHSLTGKVFDSPYCKHL